MKLVLQLRDRGLALSSLGSIILTLKTNKNQFDALHT